MKNLFKSKKSIAPLFIIVIIILVLIGVYIFLLLPVPKFAKIRTIINYFLILIFWFILQVGLIFAYYKLIHYSIRGFDTLKRKFLKFTLRINNFIVVHR